MNESFADDVLEAVDKAQQEKVLWPEESHPLGQHIEILFGGARITLSEKEIEELFATTTRLELENSYLRGLLKKATCFQDRNHGVIPDYVDEVLSDSWR